MTAPAPLSWPTALPRIYPEALDGGDVRVSYVAFDVETVRDPDFPAERLVRKHPVGAVHLTDVDDPKALKVPADELEEEFPSPPECRVVSAAAVMVGAGGELLGYAALGAGLSEEKILWNLSKLLSAGQQVGIVTWNGRRFDVPVISARLFKYGWRSPFYSAQYRYRYARVGPGAHVDLADQLSDYGSSRLFSLDKTCRMVGLPGKTFGHGSSVAELHAAGRAEEVDYYCLTDALQTALLFGRFLVGSDRVPRSTHREVARRNWEKCRPALGEREPPASFFLEPATSRAREVE